MTTTRGFVVGIRRLLVGKLRGQSKLRNKCQASYDIKICLNGSSDINGGTRKTSAHVDLRVAKHKITRSITAIPGGPSIIAFEISRLRFEDGHGAGRPSVHRARNAILMPASGARTVQSLSACQTSTRQKQHLLFKDNHTAGEFLLWDGQESAGGEILFGVDEEVWRGARPDELVGTKYTGNWSLGRAAELDILATSSWLSPNDGGRPAVPAGNQTLSPQLHRDN
ncbi:hypothetical protein LA080_000507 [Diaporthe eres]|nr:hypothetical protein LA080_000507 [Diaporthe eres]